MTPFHAMKGIYSSPIATTPVLAFRGRYNDVPYRVQATGDLAWTLTILSTCCERPSFVLEKTPLCGGCKAHLTYNDRPLVASEVQSANLTEIALFQGNYEAILWENELNREIARVFEWNPPQENFVFHGLWRDLVTLTQSVETKEKEAPNAFDSGTN